MKTLIFSYNVDEKSLTQKIADTIEESTRAHSNDEVTRFDLSTSGFDATYNLADAKRFKSGGKGPVSPEVYEQQKMLAQADTIVFVTPIYWWSIPATLKGYFERVLVAGFAFGEDDEGNPTFALQNKKIRFVALGGSPVTRYDDLGITEAIKAQVLNGIFGEFCQNTNASIELFETAWDATLVPKYEERAAQIGVEIAENTY